MANGKPLKSKSPGHVMNKYQKGQLDYTYLGMKIDAEVKIQEEKQSFKANIRIRKDSVIWMSISPALGVEVFRLVLTPDSVKYFSKIPNNKYYFEGDYDQFSNMANVQLDYHMAQDVLLGNAVGLDKDQDKYKSQVDGQQHMLTRKYSRKLKKVIGNDEKNLAPEDSVYADVTGKKYDRLLKRGDEDEFMVRRYWFDGYTYKLEKTQIDDLLHGRTIEMFHDDFKDHEGYFYPKTNRLLVKDAESQIDFQFKIVRLRTGKKYDFPFNVPEDYERRELP